MTDWNPDLSRYTGPRYKALAAAIEDGIRKGELQGGQRLPTHRSLAEQLSVTVGTITRGYAEAERRDLVTARMGSGTFIRGDSIRIREFLNPVREREAVIDLSLSFAARCGEEVALSETLTDLSRKPELLGLLLGYQTESGLPQFRQAVSQWLALMGLSVDPGGILLCCGGQNAISIALQALTRPGDRVLTEGLTYPGFIGAAKQQHLRITGVPLDDGGIIPEQLNNYCRQYKAAVLYCTPTLHNPTTVSLTEDRRRELLSVAERHDLMIIEDEVQAGLLESRPQSLAAMKPERVVHIGSFSKTLAGGLRVGYMVGPPRFMKRAGMALRSAYWMVPPLMAAIVTDWIHTGKAERILSEKRRETKRRHKHVSRVLQGLRYNSDPASYNVWLRLPEPWLADEFARRLEGNGVLVKPSGIFTADRYEGEPAVRICIGSPSHHTLVEKGLQIIRETLLDGPDMVEPVI